MSEKWGRKKPGLVKDRAEKLITPLININATVLRAPFPRVNPLKKFVAIREDRRNPTPFIFHFAGKKKRT